MGSPKGRLSETIILNGKKLAKICAGGHKIALKSIFSRFRGVITQAAILKNSIFLDFLVVNRPYFQENPNWSLRNFVRRHNFILKMKLTLMAKIGKNFKLP